jgi:hypothetical protein
VFISPFKFFADSRPLGEPKRHSTPFRYFNVTSSCHPIWGLAAPDHRAAPGFEPPNFSTVAKRFGFMPKHSLSGPKLLQNSTGSFLSLPAVRRGPRRHSTGEIKFGVLPLLNQARWRSNYPGIS